MKKDPLSIGLCFLAIALSLNLMTYDVLFQPLFISCMLGVAGIAFMEWGVKDTDPVAQNYFSSSSLVMFGYTILGFIVLSLIGFVGVNLSIIDTLSVADKIQYGIAISINEESFFRGAFLEWLLANTGWEGGSIVVSSVFFTAYHFYVTGFVWSKLAFIFLAGIVLGKIYCQTRRLWPSSLTHILHNVRMV
ncbi:unnamed protein product, partial [marine sediment metagenome]